MIVVAGEWFVDAVLFVGSGLAGSENSGSGILPRLRNGEGHRSAAGSRSPQSLALFSQMPLTYTIANKCAHCGHSAGDDTAELRDKAQSGLAVLPGSLVGQIDAQSTPTGQRFTMSK